MLQAAIRFHEIEVRIRLAISEQRTDSHRQWVIYNHCGHQLSKHSGEGRKQQTNSHHHLAK